MITPITANTSTWVVGGVLGLVCYVIVSNTLYLLLGARLLQFLPGVNIRGFTGTLRLALLFIITAIACAVWAIRQTGHMARLPVQHSPLHTEIGNVMRRAAGLLHTLGQTARKRSP